VYDHALHAARLAAEKSSVIDRARAHLILSKTRGSNTLFCNEVRCFILIAVCACTHLIRFALLLQLKLLHMMAGMRMSWEARSMNVIVAKVSSGNCAVGKRHASERES
jgi:hypothetical protein